MTNCVVTAAHIRNALQVRYPRDVYKLLWEVANSTGAEGKRFADAVAFNMWPSHGHEIEGIEIKVSRSDFLHEMKQPAKSQPVFQFCNRWWLAVPKDLVHPDEVPNTWGLMELVGDSMRVKKKAPALSAIEPTKGFLAAMLRRGVGMDEEMYNARLAKELKNMHIEISALEKAHAVRSVEGRVKNADEAMAKIKEIKERTGLDFCNHTPASEWITAIKFLTEDSWNNKFSADNIRDLSNKVENFLNALNKLPKLD